jgi:hypothetical protein
VTQPWTDRHLFRPLGETAGSSSSIWTSARRRHRHPADILSDADLPRIKAFKPKAILCCNILEHVREPEDAGAPLHGDRGAGRD